MSVFTFSRLHSKISELDCDKLERWPRVRMRWWWGKRTVPNVRDEPWNFSPLSSKWRRICLMWSIFLVFCVGIDCFLSISAVVIEKSHTRRVWKCPIEILSKRWSRQIVNKVQNWYSTVSVRASTVFSKTSNKLSVIRTHIVTLDESDTSLAISLPVQNAPMRVWALVCVLWLSWISYRICRTIFWSTLEQILPTLPRLEFVPPHPRNSWEEVLLFTISTVSLHFWTCSVFNLRST